LTEKRKADPERHTIAITQQEISEMVGMTRESVNKQLRAWATRNWVRLEHGAIVVLDAPALRELAQAGAQGEE
jgi:CRP-like cAMP-binding protein